MSSTAFLPLLKKFKREVCQSCSLFINEAIISASVPQDVCRPEDWNDLVNVDPYTESKTCAERAAFEFVANVPHD